MWSHVESAHLTTSEAAKKWTETSPKSTLNKVNSKLSSAKSNEAKELKDLISKREYKDFQKKIWMKSYYDLDWKIWPKTYSTFLNYLEKFERTNETIHETDEELNNLRDDIQDNNDDYSELEQVFQDYVHRPEYQQLTDYARIHKNAREYLSEHESIDEHIYNGLFSGKESIRQWRIWNCYLVSWIMELANADYFDTLMRTSISRVRFKDDWELWYNIRIPLWEPNGRDILIKDTELPRAKLVWNIGYQLLEIAYVKNRRPNNKNWNKYAPVSEWEYQNTVWGSTGEVLQTFLGKNNIWFCNFWSYDVIKKKDTLSSLDQNRKTEITNFFKHYNWTIWNSFAFLATAPWAQWQWDTESFLVWWNRFYHNHAYALQSVEKDWMWNVSRINIRNPWNDQRRDWTWDLSLTMNDFFNAFSYIEVWRIKADTFLDNKWVSWA
jgi:hypothetical protein